MRTPPMTSIRRVLLGLIVVATAFATTASAHAAYLTLGTSNTSNAQTTLTGNSSGRGAQGAEHERRPAGDPGRSDWGRRRLFRGLRVADRDVAERRLGRGPRAEQRH